MVLCLIALPLFAILGIFSASYRQLAREAFSCVFKKITLQPCDTGLDTRIKTSVVGPIFRRSQRVGGFVYRHFTFLSWFFVILSIATLLGVAWGGYNYYLYGNCNGANSSGFCVFDPSGANQQFSSSGSSPGDAGNGSAIGGIGGLGSCSTQSHAASQLQFSWFNTSLHATLNGSNGKTLWMIGCYNCPYTRETWPIIRSLQKQYNFTLVFAHLPLHPEDQFASRVGYCIRQQSPDKFWSFADAMFSAPANSSRNESFVIAAAQSLGFDPAAMQICAASNATSDELIDEVQNIAAVGVYGTPTIYSGGLALVGPKPKRVYERLID